MKRAPLSAPLTFMQKVVVVLVGQGHNYADIGERLNISPRTAKEYAEIAASRMPGDLPTQFRIVAWYRGDLGRVLLGREARQAEGRREPIFAEDGAPVGELHSEIQDWDAATDRALAFADALPGVNPR